MTAVNEYFFYSNLTYLNAALQGLLYAYIGLNVVCIGEDCVAAKKASDTRIHMGVVSCYTQSPVAGRRVSNSTSGV